MKPLKPNPPDSRCARPSAWTLKVVALACALVTPALHAQPERESLEALRQTTLALIDVLVQNGTLSRESADALLAEARRRADAALAQAAAEPPPVRVPYVPQVVRDQIRNEIREEVVARARAERWGLPGSAAEWTQRLTITGDLRVRAQSDRPSPDNPTPQQFLAASLGGTTRAPDLAAGNAVGLATANTQEDRERLRLRARLGIQARVNDQATVGLGLATGSATDRVSTNQTLGQNFNRYAFLLERAYVRFEPVDWVAIDAGRFANPWFSSDLAWSDNLNFEGIAASFRRPSHDNSLWRPFATLGFFPVRESVPPRRSRGIVGAQLGTQWEPSALTQFKLGLAQYSFRNFEGQVDPDFDAITGAGRSYGQFEYEAGLRQRGNTLFLTNNPLEIAGGLTPDRARWGLASRFRTVAITGAAQFSHFAPVIVGLSGEVIRNMAFDPQEILARTGVTVSDARAYGVNVRATVGSRQVRDRDDWQLSLGYTWLGSDAVPDAFVGSDLALGGTNVRGLTGGLIYGVARDTSVGLRLLAGRTISSPTVQPGLKDKYSVFSIQADFNVRF